jgi:carnitine O-palmitoyltransferase 1
MIGNGVDRHLFALYIVSKGLDRPSDFLIHALTMPWRLSTSQQPQDQTLLRKDLPKAVAERFVSPGGGFGPVADDGYGVSYMFAGENQFFFHISSKISAPNTSSKKFASDLMKALDDMRRLFTTA